MKKYQKNAFWKMLVFTEYNLTIFTLYFEVLVPMVLWLIETTEIDFDYGIVERKIN